MKLPEQRARHARAKEIALYEFQRATDLFSSDSPSAYQRPLTELYVDATYILSLWAMLIATDCAIRPEMLDLMTDQTDDYADLLRNRIPREI